MKCFQICRLHINIKLREWENNFIKSVQVINLLILILITQMKTNKEK